MGDILNGLANILNTGGGMNTVIWFTVLMVALIVYAFTDIPALKPVAAASGIMLAVSFSKLELTYQAVLFALIVVAGLLLVYRRKPAEAAETGAEAEVETETETKAETEAEVETEAETEAETETETETEAETGAETEPDIETRTGDAADERAADDVVIDVVADAGDDAVDAADDVVIDVVTDAADAPVEVIHTAPAPETPRTAPADEA